MADAVAPVEKYKGAMQGLQASAAGFHKQMGFLEKRGRKIQGMFLDTAVGSLVVYSQAFMKTTRAMVGLHEQEEDQLKALAEMTLAQKLVHRGAFQYNSVLGFMHGWYEKVNANIEESNKGWSRTKLFFLRLGTYAMMLGIVILGLVTGFILLDIAVGGSNAAVLEGTENYKGLHYTLLGLTTLLTGEGGASGWQMLAGAIALAAVAAIVFSPKIGGITLALGLMGIAFRLVEKETGSWQAGLMGAVATGVALLGIVSYLGWAFTGFSTGIAAHASWIGASFASVLVGVGLVAAGIVGLFMIATGRVEEGKEGIVYTLTAAAIAVGGFLLGLAAFPAILVGLVAVFLADAANLISQGNFWSTWGERWDAMGLYVETKITEIEETIGGLVDGIVEWGSDVWAGWMIGLSLLEQWGPRLWENWKATWIAPMYAEWDALVVKAGDAWAGFKAEFWDPLESTFNLVMAYGPMIFSEWRASLFNKISVEIASLQTQVSEMLGSVTGAIDRLVTRSQEKLAGIWAAFSMAGSSAVDSIKTYLDGLIPFVTFDELVSMATDTAYNQMADVINPFITAYNSFPLTDDISLMATRAEGGPVIGGQPYIVGEKGPEVFTPGSSGAIIPNDQLGGGGGEQTITMNINVGGVTDRTDKRALAREIGDLLTQELRRQGGAPTRGRF